MPMSKYQRKRQQVLKQKAVKLYKQGLTLREVGNIIGKSHEWVRMALADLTRNDRGV